MSARVDSWILRGVKSMIKWTELDPNLCEILEKYPDTDGGFSLKIRHPDAGRPKIFLESEAGNWYWLAPKPKISGEIGTGYIIKGLIIPLNRPICFGSLKVTVVGPLCKCEFILECIEAYEKNREGLE